MVIYTSSLLEISRDITNTTARIVWSYACPLVYKRIGLPIILTEIMIAEKLDQKNDRPKI